MAARLHWDQHIARPEAVVSELAASATMPVRAVQCRKICAPDRQVHVNAPAPH